LIRADSIGGMTSLSRASARSMPVPRPAPRRLRAADVVGLLGANVALIVLMWVRHGGLDRLGTVADVTIGVGDHERRSRHLDARRRRASGPGPALGDRVTAWCRARLLGAAA
jgi:hypothetical protein